MYSDIPFGKTFCQTFRGKKAEKAFFNTKLRDFPEN